MVMVPFVKFRQMFYINFLRSICQVRCIYRGSLCFANFQKHQGFIQSMTTKLIDPRKLFVYEEEKTHQLIICFKLENPLTGAQSYIELQRQKHSLLSEALQRIKLKAKAIQEKHTRSRPVIGDETGSEETGNAKEPNLAFYAPDGAEISVDSVITVNALVDGSTLQLMWPDLNHTQKWVVHLEPARLTKFAIDLTLVAGFPVLPKLNIMNGNLKNCRFHWYIVDCSSFHSKAIEHFEVDYETGVIASNDFRLTEVSRDFVYWPSTEHSYKFICVTCLPFSTHVTPDSVSNPGLCSILVINLSEKSKKPIVSGVKPIFEDRHKLTTTVLPALDSFRVVSYNTLAEIYAKTTQAAKEFFPYCSAEYLSRHYAVPLLLSEIYGYNADIICLQEVDSRSYSRYMKPFLETYDHFESLWLQKGGTVDEGCGLFYRTTKLRFVRSFDAMLSELLQDTRNSDLYSLAAKNKTLLDTILSRPTCLQVTLCEVLSRQNHFLIIVNTHLYYSPLWNSIRLLQAMMCLRRIEDFVLQTKAENSGCTVSVILCGDLNSAPESGAIQLLCNEDVASDHPDWLTPDSEVKATGINLQSPLRLYAASEFPEFTTYTVRVEEGEQKGYKGCLDYIFIDDSFYVTKVLPLPNFDAVTKNVAIPSKDCPSDHLPVICEIKLK